MVPHSPHKPRRRQEEGIALVVVLLFTTIVLTIVVSTTATLALGARGGGVNERGAYQALLGAESALNTFAIRYATQMRSLPESEQLRGNVSPAQLNSWLLQYGLTTNPGGSGNLYPLQFEGSASNLTLVSTGILAGGSKKVVLQDYRATYRPAYNVRADAPLVSYPNVDVKGGAVVSGERVVNSNGMVNVARVNELTALTVNTTAVQPTFTLNLTQTLGSRLLLSAGDYVDIGGITYEVTAVQGTQATLRPMTQPSVATILRDAPVNRLDCAVTADFQQQSGTETAVSVSDPTFLVKGSKVQIGSLMGTVTTIDSMAKTIRVMWDASPSGFASIPRGTPVKRDVRSVASGYDVTGETLAVPDGTSQNDIRLRNMNPFNPNSTPELFTHTFGQTKDQMLRVIPYNGWLDPVVGTFSGTVSGITLVNGTLNLGGTQSLCGSGVLIVKGNLTVNGTCEAGFRGVIYVMGDYDQQGNSQISGAVIAEGATEIVTGTECVPNPTDGSSGSGSGNSCDVQIAGTGQGNGKITYDRAALLEAGSLLTPPTFTALQGTWRQR